MPTTPNKALRYPLATDTPDVPRDLGYLAVDVDTVLADHEGAWTTAWTPTFGGVTLGNGTVSGRVKLMGKSVDFIAVLNLGTTTVITGPVTLTLPYAGMSVHGLSALSAAGVDTGVTDYPLGVAPSSTTVITLYGIGTAGAYAAGNGYVSATVPFTWGATDFIVVRGRYERA